MRTTNTSSRTLIKAVVCLGLIPALIPGGDAGAAVIFTDFQTLNTTSNVATGDLGAAGVTLTGTDLASGVLDGTSTFFNQAFFTPQLAMSDFLQISFSQSQTATFSIAFDTPITDPVIHLQSLASELTFPGEVITKLSGQSTFVVAGDMVTGTIDDGSFPTDANGTIQLSGTFSAISFWGDILPGASVDGVRI
ncbi:MAG: hypothetical protein DWQ42_03325 [Planctomycetota bacterium]|nr:MAG: hypothetical protein DWQ42_03325 [Planctomycetota bacterium]REK47885.1 MAG: hypothetical protein DWQ46_03035 [Planctomycetota bacterium]